MRRIAHLSDLHFGRHDKRVEHALLESLTDARPDLIAISGDFTQRARNEQFSAARAFLDRIPQPKLIVPGNHDMPLYDVVARLFRPFEKFNRHIRPAGLQPPFYVDEEIAILGLNTARRLTGKNGRVSREQMVLIRQTFANMPDDKLKVLVTHHPLGTAEGGARVELALRSADALEAVADARVDVLLSGHHHQASSGGLDAELAFDDKVLVVHAGTAISDRLRGGEGNSYNLLDCDADRLTVRVMECTSPRGFEESEEAVYMHADCWRRQA